MALCAGLVLLAPGTALADADKAGAAPAQVAAHTPDGAVPRGFALTYDVYQSGLRALRLTFDVDVAAGEDGDGGHAAPETYRTEVTLETSGLVGFLFDWSLDARSEGRWRAGALTPEHHRTANVWRGNERWVEIDWRDGVPAEVRAEPPYGADDRAKITPEMLPGTMDPMSAVTAMVLSHTRETPCRARTRIYDGRRRYDALLSPLGRRELEASNFAPFAGPAEGCLLTFNRIAGFKEGSNRMRDIEAEIWLADLGIATGEVPVRLRLDTPWGIGFAHLVRAARADGSLVFGEPEDADEE